MLYGTICCMGDSLTAGARALLGYPEHLPSLLRAHDAETEWATRNFGISGQTTREILDRVPAAVGWLAGQTGSKRFILLAGTNDAKAGGRQSITVDEWESLYRQALHWPRRHGIPIVLCTFPPLETNTREMPYFTDRSRAWLDEASERVRQIAKDLDCVPAPISLCELSDMPKNLLCDGVHLKPAGYRWMAQRISVALGYSAETEKPPVKKKAKNKRPCATEAKPVAPAKVPENVSENVPEPPVKKVRRRRVVRESGVTEF